MQLSVFVALGLAQLFKQQNSLSLTVFPDAARAQLAFLGKHALEQHARVGQGLRQHVELLEGLG